ncbi:MAG: GNAT family N-acetyltransferase [Bacteroidales bacterium]|nr:GNAT family N-acetyltransferase [Bacteroidales bacterium]
MNKSLNFDLSKDAVKVPYTAELAAFCTPFCCEDNDLDDFFTNVALHYDSELLGKTYAWVNKSDPKEILGMITLSNDSVKLKLIAKSALNRLQRSVINTKRGINYPAVLIGRLGVSTLYRGKGLKIGSQIIDYVKEWFKSTDNKTGCRFIVVDAYNNDKTIHFYKKNGFKPLYKSEDEERTFLELSPQEPLKTRFMFFDLKSR